MTGRGLGWEEEGDSLPAKDRVKDIGLGSSTEGDGVR